jgi:hypothetical protein
MSYISDGGVSSINTLTGAITLAAGANITLTPVLNTITISAAIYNLTWSREVATPVVMIANHGYVQANAGVGLTTFTLPATAALGTIISIVGESSGGWTITQAAGQSIQYGNLATTVGVAGHIDSTNRYDTVTLVCRVADTTWSVLHAPVGMLNVI